jgi:hypothetical protein
VLSLSSKFDPVENMVVIPIPPLVIHTLIPVEVPEAFIPLSLQTTPSPPYVASHEEDLVHDGVLEYWVDLGAGCHCGLFRVFLKLQKYPVLPMTRTLVYLL